MKILVCVDRLTGGGAQRVASLWASGWSKEGHDVSIVLSNIRAPKTYFVPDKVKIYNIDWNIKNKYVRYFLKLIFNRYRIRRIVRTVNPDVVVTVGISWNPLIYELKTKLELNFKLISTDHNSYERPSYAPLTKKEEYLKFELNKKMDLVTVLTQADMDYIGNRLSNVYVLPNPLTLTPIKDISCKENIILAAGRLDDWHCKGFDLLIKAWGNIASLNPDWKLLIAGAGRKSSLQKLRAMVAKENISETQIEFLGFCNDMQSIYRKSSIFILSSRYEGFGMVLTEAMSQGCACIACDYKGRQKEIITSENEGIICPTDDYESLALNLNRMISDKKYRTKVQYQSPQRASVYSLDNIMKHWDIIFQELNLI